MIKQMALSAVILLCILAGCTTTRVWTSTPQVSELGSSYYKVLFEPLTKEHTFYVLFRLEVANKTNKDLRIDWNKTRYLLNGRSHGGFVFEGIDPQNISKQTIPDDIVPAGETFSKEIAPYTMLARAPLRIKERSEGEEAIKPGPLPAGENGILLVIRQDGQEISDKVTIKIEVSERKDWF
jgi:hypothetical protein